MRRLIAGSSRKRHESCIDTGPIFQETSSMGAENIGKPPAAWVSMLRKHGRKMDLVQLSARLAPNAPWSEVKSWGVTDSIQNATNSDRDTEIVELAVSLWQRAHDFVEEEDATRVDFRVEVWGSEEGGDLKVLEACVKGGRLTRGQRGSVDAEPEGEDSKFLAVAIRDRSDAVKQVIRLCEIIPNVLEKTAALWEQTLGAQKAQSEAATIEAKERTNQEYNAAKVEVAKVLGGKMLDMLRERRQTETAAKAAGVRLQIDSLAEACRLFAETVTAASMMLLQEQGLDMPGVIAVCMKAGSFEGWETPVKALLLQIRKFPQIMATFTASERRILDEVFRLAGIAQTEPETAA